MSLDQPKQRRTQTTASELSGGPTRGHADYVDVRWADTSLRVLARRRTRRLADEPAKRLPYHPQLCLLSITSGMHRCEFHDVSRVALAFPPTPPRMLGTVDIPPLPNLLGAGATSLPGRTDPAAATAPQLEQRPAASPAPRPAPVLVHRTPPIFDALPVVALLGSRDDGVGVLGRVRSARMRRANKISGPDGTNGRVVPRLRSPHVCTLLECRCRPKLPPRPLRGPAGCQIDSATVRVSLRRLPAAEAPGSRKVESGPPSRQVCPRGCVGQ